MDSDVCDTPFDWAVTIKGGFCDECVWHVCTLATFQQEEIAFPYPVYAKRACAARKFVPKTITSKKDNFDEPFSNWYRGHLGACNLLGVKQILHRILSGEFVFPPVDYKPLIKFSQFSP